MATAPKSKAPKRKGKKQYTLVTFEHSAFEGEFQIPSIKEIPIRVQRGISSQDLGPLIAFFEEYAPNAAEPFDDLSGEDESEEFFSKWAKASGADLGK